jgi:hypothetical protein
MSMTDSDVSGPGPLNLANADLKDTFDAVDPGRYNAKIFAMTMDAVKNLSGTGKMPAGTPMIKVQYQLLSDATGKTEGINNRRVFQTFVIPPKEYDPAKAATLLSFIGRFFVALGDSEATVKSEGFNPNFEDYIDRECVVVLGKEPKKDQSGNVVPGEYNNPVKGVKPAGSIITSEDASNALL